MTYKHDAIIREWLDGKPVQVYQGSRKLPYLWLDLPSPDNIRGWVPFSTFNEYRIKPEPKPDVVEFRNINDKGVFVGRIALTIDGETGKLKYAEVV